MIACPRILVGMWALFTCICTSQTTYKPSILGCILTSKHNYILADLVFQSDEPIHFLFGGSRDLKLEKSRPLALAYLPRRLWSWQGSKDKRCWGLGQVWRFKTSHMLGGLPSSLRPEHQTTACNCCSTSIIPLPHIHRHWPPCLLLYRPRPSRSHSALLLVPRQLLQQRSRPRTSRTISSGPTLKNHMQRGGKQSSRHTRRYISLETSWRRGLRLRIAMDTRSSHGFTGSETLRS